MDTLRYVVHPNSVRGGLQHVRHLDQCPYLHHMMLVLELPKLPAVPAHWLRLDFHTCSSGITHLGRRRDRDSSIFLLGLEQCLKVLLLLCAHGDKGLVLVLVGSCKDMDKLSKR